MITKIETEIKDLLTEISSMSQSCKDVEEVVSSIKYLHRTHQQGLGRFLREMVRVFAEMHKDGRYDLRNQGTCEMCVDLLEKADEAVLPYI